LGYIPSVGNFLTLDVGRPAGPLNLELLRSGVIVRPIANYGLPNHLRISVGLEGENQRCVDALTDILAR
jgi:histidinol-phosphate aminotransferase